MFDIMAVMDQKDSCDISFAAQRQSLMVQTIRRTITFPSCCTRFSTPCCAGRAGSLPRRGAEAGSMVQTVRRTMDIPQLLHTILDVPVVVEQVHFPVVAQRQVPRSKPFVGPWTFYSC